MQYIRWAVACIVQPHVKKTVDPKKLLPLSSDSSVKQKKSVSKVLNDKRIDDIFEMWDKFK